MLQVTFLARSGIRFWKSFFFILIHIQDCLFLNYVFCPCKSSKSKYSTYDHYKSTLSYCTKSLTICTCIKKSSPHYQEKWSSTLSSRIHLHWNTLFVRKPNVFSLSVARLFCCYLHLDSIRNLPAMASNVATKTTKSAESFLTSEDLYYWLTTWPTVSAQLKLVVIGLRRRQVSF